MGLRPIWNRQPTSSFGINIVSFTFLYFLYNFTYTMFYILI